MGQYAKVKQTASFDIKEGSFYYLSGTEKRKKHGTYAVNRTAACSTSSGSSGRSATEKKKATRVTGFGRGASQRQFPRPKRLKKGARGFFHPGTPCGQNGGPDV